MDILKHKKALLRVIHEKGRLFVALPPFFTSYSHNRPQSDIHQHLSTITGGARRSLLHDFDSNYKLSRFGAQLGDVFVKNSACASHQPAALCR